MKSPCRLLAALIALGCVTVRAEEAPPPTPDAPAKKFIRLEQSASGVPIALQTGVLEMKSSRPAEAGVSVDLIGAIHVGDKRYYEALNEAFKAYDVVLYEMVAPPGTRVAKGAQPSNHPVSVIQNSMKDLLGLEHQLAIVDYSPANLTHADMSPEQFAKSMQDRHESLWDLLWRSLQHQIAKKGPGTVLPTGPGDVALIMALFDDSQKIVLKRYLAQEFQDVDELARVMDGPTGSTLISERNKVALEGVKKEIAAGKKRIAVFYGAAHLPDMERRLVADFGMQPVGERWITAWDLPEPAAKAPKKARKSRSHHARSHQLSPAAEAAR
jgi:hypothetical protein